MDDWKIFKNNGEKCFAEGNFIQARDQYKTCFTILTSGLELTDPQSDSNNDLKVEASKVSSNLSLMYLKLWQHTPNDYQLIQSKIYAKQSIDLNPSWLKGYVRLVDACQKLHVLDDALVEINSYIRNYSHDNEPETEHLQSMLVDIKYYTHKSVMKLSPSWHLVKYPKNVYYVDDKGAGHFRNFSEFLQYQRDTPTKKISVLVRPGTYIGTYLIRNATIDIIGDCDVTVDETTKAVNCDPLVVFTNDTCIPSICLNTFTLDSCKVWMNRITVKEKMMTHPVHAISTHNTEMKLNSCSISSICSGSLSCYGNSNVTCLSCRFADCYQAIIMGTESLLKLVNCHITRNTGLGIEVRDNAERISLNNCTVARCQKQGLVVYNGAKVAEVKGCHFEANCLSLGNSVGSIQLRNCNAFVYDTTIKNQNHSDHRSVGIVIESGSGKFSNLCFENCTTGMLVQANVVIANSVFKNCLFAINLCHEIRGSVVLENNRMIGCFKEIMKQKESKVIFNGSTKNKMETHIVSDVLLEKYFKKFRRARSKKVEKELNFGPVGNVLGINEKQVGIINPASLDACEYCGLDEFQSQRKLKSCGKCKMSRYCSTECQKANWKIHKPQCDLFLKTRHNAKQMSELYLSEYKVDEINVHYEDKEEVQDEKSSSEPIATTGWKKKTKKKKKKKMTTF